MQKELRRGFVGGRTSVCAVYRVDLGCVHLRGRALPSACVQSTVPILSKEGMRRLFLNDFMSLSHPLTLPAVLFSLSPPFCLSPPTHSVALILPQAKVVSVQLSQVPIHAVHSTGQRVILGCVGGIFLMSN